MIAEETNTTSLMYDELRAKMDALEAENTSLRLRLEKAQKDHLEARYWLLLLRDKHLNPFINYVLWSTEDSAMG